MKILMLAGSSSDPASRFRLYQYAEPLRRLGHEVEIRPSKPSRYWNSSLRMASLKKIDSLAGSFCRILNAFWRIRDIEEFDVVLMNRDLVPETSISFFEPWMSKRNPHLIFDFDDAIHLGARQKKLKKIFLCFQRIVSGNQVLADFAEQIVGDRNVIIPTVVDTQFFTPVPERRPGPLRVGWSGSVSSFSMAAPLLQKIAERLSPYRDLEFILALEKNPGISWPGCRIQYRAWSAEEEVSIIQDFDIGLMPLQDTDFEKGKCGLKAIQYMACAVPAFVSPVGVNQQIVDHGRSGFHCRNIEEWFSFIETGIKDPDSLAKMGAAGRQKAVREYSVQAVLDDFVKLLEGVSGGPNRKARKGLL